jgi:mannitol/fructose-specific phosphotransferase system IIA component (Ntr-type)
MIKDYIIDYLNENFELKIIKRGFDYYNQSKVTDAVMTEDNSIIFNVSGTDQYQVEIMVKDNKIIDIDCCCPYAATFNCKHMAAALFYLTENKVDKKIDSNLIEDKKLRSFKRKVSSEVAANDYDDEDFADNIIFIIDSAFNDIYEMVKNKEIRLAIDCVFYLFEEIDYSATYDCSNQLIDVEDIMNKVLIEIINLDFTYFLEKIEISISNENIYNYTIYGAIEENIKSKKIGLEYYNFIKNNLSNEKIKNNHYLLTIFQFMIVKLSLKYCPKETVDLMKKYSDDVEVIEISPILTDDNLKKIDDKLNELSIASEDASCQLFDLIKEETTLMNCDCKTKKEAIQIISARLESTGYVSSGYADEVLAREEISSTEIGNYCAIPHAINSKVKKQGIGIMILNKPIMWDKQKVQIVFMIALDETCKISFREVFEYISNLHSNIKLIGEISKVTDYKELADKIAKNMKE